MKIDETLLRQILEEHARDPYGSGILEDASHSAEWKSPKTGNTCRVQLKKEKKLIKKLVAQVEGSALAKACASIMCCELEEETVEHVQSLHRELEQWIKHRIAPVQWKGDLKVYQSLVQFPERIDCAMLCWKSLGLISFAED